MSDSAEIHSLLNNLCCDSSFDEHKVYSICQAISQHVIGINNSSLEVFGIVSELVSRISAYILDKKKYIVEPDCLVQIIWGPMITFVKLFSEFNLQYGHDVNELMTALVHMISIYMYDIYSGSITEQQFSMVNWTMMLFLLNRLCFFFVKFYTFLERKQIFAILDILSFRFAMQHDMRHFHICGWHQRRHSVL